MRLVFLQFASNTCYVKVVEEPPEGVTVDTQQGVWTYVHASKQFMPKKIGEGRYLENNRFGVIGVYDRDNIAHLNSMARDAIEAVRERGSMLDD